MQGFGAVLMAGAEVTTMLRNFDIQKRLNTFHYFPKKKEHMTMRSAFVFVALWSGLPRRASSRLHPHGRRSSIRIDAERPSETISLDAPAI